MSSSEPKIRSVLFDMDGVLCDLDDHKRLQYLLPFTTKSPEELAFALWGSGFEDESDVGKFSADEYVNEFGARVGCKMDAELWQAYRKSGMTPKYEMLDLARQLATEYDVAILTNNGHMLKKSISVLFPELIPIFGDRVFVSAEFQCRKPNPKVYLDLCLQLKWKPSEVLFIDDREENVVGAKDTGLEALCFKTVDEFRSQLRLHQLI